MPRVQQHAYLAFEVKGRNLKPENTNPILHKFYYMLKDLKLEKGGMKIVVTDKDRAILEQLDSTWIKGSIHLNMEVINYPGKEHIVRGLDHETGAFLLRELGKLRVEEGKGKIRIDVTEVTFSESYHKFPQVWPKDQIPIVGF